MPETQWYPEGQEPLKQGMISWVKLCRILKPVPSVLTANTVPSPEPPPPDAVPYRVWPDKSNSACGLAPSLQAKLCRAVNAVPSVLTANTVPWPEPPPPSAVP